MCYLKPLKIKEIKKNIAILDNGIRARIDTKHMTLKKNDRVLVFGNLIVEKV